MHPLFRSVYKQLRVLAKEEPNIAQLLSRNIKLHVEQYRRTQQRMDKKIKKQKNHELLSAFLNCLVQASLSNKIISHRAKIKLVEIYTGVNPFLDQRCFLRKNQLCKHVRLLQANPQFKNLPTEQDRDFVRGVINKVMKGEQRYQYKNLTAFFIDNKYQPIQNTGSKLAVSLSPQIREYVQKVINGEVVGVSNEYIKIYKKMFTDDSRSSFQKTLDSYIESRYILIDFDEIGHFY